MAERVSRISRRRFLGSAVGLAAGAQTIRGDGAARSAAGQAPQPATTTGVDQNPIRRRGVGLRGLDANRASAGSTLFAPMADHR